MRGYYLGKDIFGYSIWKEQPFFDKHEGCFKTESYPYEEDKSYYVSEELVKMIFDNSKLPQFGVLMEFTLSEDNHYIFSTNN